MSQRIALRQRIATIETIKKTTGAMRLIAMSSHSQLRGKKAILDAYKNALLTIQQRTVTADDSELSTNSEHHKNQLFVLISSQKGLCGSFNQTLFNFIEKQQLLTTQSHVITIGKEAENYCATHAIKPLHKAAIPILQQFIITAETVAQWVLEQNYDELVIISTKPRSFFIQEPTTTVAPLTARHTASTLNKTIHALSLSATLIQTLYDSLLAEQAARFLSMDGATQNADTMLTDMKILYNKTRQADVTRELAELTGALSLQP